VDAPTYLEQFVEPPYSRRHAFLACVVTFHTIDYIKNPNMNKQNSCKKFREESNEFAIVDRVANAFKHIKSGHDNGQRNQPLHVKHVYSRPPARCGVMQCGLSRLLDTTGKVALWGEDNSDLLPAVKEVAKFLRTKCRCRVDDAR
jgi:hypothetical protein